MWHRFSCTSRTAPGCLRKHVEMSRRLRRARVHAPCTRTTSELCFGPRRSSACAGARVHAFAGMCLAVVCRGFSFPAMLAVSRALLLDRRCSLRAFAVWAGVSFCACGFFVASGTCGGFPSVLRCLLARTPCLHSVVLVGVALGGGLSRLWRSAVACCALVDRDCLRPLEQNKWCEAAVVHVHVCARYLSK